MKIECTKPRQFLKRKINEDNKTCTKPTENIPSDGDEFLNGLIYLNPKLVRRVEERVPIYRALANSYNASHSNLPSCYLWPSKETPPSVLKSQICSFSGKIYSSVSAKHIDDSLVVQETESRIGYLPSLFVAKATVAFPPVCEGEVWTVGWIQALKKNEAKFIRQNLRQPENMGRQPKYLTLVLLKLLFYFIL